MSDEEKTYGEVMVDWVDRIIQVALKYMPEGADRNYVECMADQYKETIRTIESVHERRYDAGSMAEPVK